ncbi:MAG: molecular chaperone DnaJ [Christensenellaceae bacterium]|jgi:molecular chaperone DnaJ|nr:molecular chaperone DnaJ [Christensenellaceae bacterium]
MAADYYKILGVDKKANADDIKSAYRRLAKTYHPDVFATASDAEKSNAEKKFKEIQHAYDVLSDPNKKAAFDNYGDEEGPQHTGGGGFQYGGFTSDVFHDLFNAFANAGRGRTRNSAMQGDHLEYTLNLTFKEAYTGVEKEISFFRIENCVACKGTGARNGNAFKVCTKCGGRGKITVSSRTVLGIMNVETVCDMCHGSGKIITDVCPDCKGKAHNKVRRSLKVAIPAGVADGQTLTLANEGQAGVNGGPNGNLFVLFRVAAHPIFERSDYDLKMTMPIPVFDAVMGCTVDVPTMTTPVKVVIPESTEDGATIRIKGRGMKVLGKETYGDLYVRVTLDIPKGISSKQKKLIKDLGNIFADSRYDKTDKFRKKLRDI